MLHRPSPFRHSLVTHTWQAGSGELLGSASAGPVSGLTGVWISGFVRVALEARGRGIGTALVKSVLGAAESAGATRVHCLIEPDNTGSIRIHERAGYRMAPAECSYLMRASGTSEPDDDLSRSASEQVDRRTFRNAAKAAGYGESMTYFPRLLAATSLSPHHRLISVASDSLRKLRHRPIERRLIVRTANELIAGLILATPAEPRLMIQREWVERLTAPRLVALENKVPRANWSHDNEPGFLLLHDEKNRPDPTLVLKRLSVFAV